MIKLIGLVVMRVNEQVGSTAIYTASMLLSVCADTELGLAYNQQGFSFQDKGFKEILLPNYTYIYQACN